MKTDMKTYMTNVFFISWLVFSLFYFDRDNYAFSNNWFSYLGFAAFVLYFIYSLKREAQKRSK